MARTETIVGPDDCSDSDIEEIENRLYQALRRCRDARHETDNDHLQHTHLDVAQNEAEAAWFMIEDWSP